MKLGLFADPHCSTREVTCGTRHPSRSLEKIRALLEDFRARGVDTVLCLGDLIDADCSHAQDVENLARVSSLLRDFGDALCVMGNHDGFCFSREEFAAVSGLPTAPLHRRMGAADILLLDANYTRAGLPYDGTEGDWTDCALPEEELAWLEETLKTCGPNTWVFVHQLLDPAGEPHHRAANACRVRAILSASGKVKGVVQGHFHPGAETTADGIPYITLPALCEEGIPFGPVPLSVILEL